MDSSMIVHEMPLLALFHKLRQAGLPLGIDEYQLLVRALQSGFGLPDRTSLARLCKTLWVKSADEERLFEYHFEQVMPRSTITEPTSSQPQLADQTEVAPITSKPPSDFPPATTSEWTLKIEDEVQVAKAVLQTAGENDDTVYDYFIQTDEYFPITRRQMKQSWRYLRRPIREGPPIELDIESTVKKVGSQGILLEPVLVPRRVNRTELVLLIDQGGSMVPFHALSRRLAETALRGGRLGKADIYYFHNCPTENLYRDPAHQEAEPIQDLLNHLHYGRTRVLVFSDAGAARGGLSPERVKMIEEFLHRFKLCVRYMAWLNPMPRSRWLGTTAGEVMHLVPMFDISRRGLDDAISVLRGRPTPYIHIEVGI